MSFINMMYLNIKFNNLRRFCQITGSLVVIIEFDQKCCEGIALCKMPVKLLEEFLRKQLH